MSRVTESMATCQWVPAGTGKPQWKQVPATAAAEPAPEWTDCGAARLLATALTAELPGPHA